MKMRQIQIMIDVDTEVFEGGKMHSELGFVLEQVRQKVMGHIQPGSGDFMPCTLPQSLNCREILHNSEGGDTGTIIIVREKE